MKRDEAKGGVGRCETLEILLTKEGEVKIKDLESPRTQRKIQTMSSYEPEQRKISAQILTRAGWLSGTFHVPLKQSMLEYLNHSDLFYKLTDVELPYGMSVEFFALQRNSVSLVVPLVEESELALNHPTGDHVRREISCLLDSGALDATLGILKDIRVSDYLHTHAGFCVMRNCKTHGVDTREAPIVLVNTDQMVGVTEPAPA